MGTVYVVTADGYCDGYGSEIYLIGVFKDEETANAMVDKYPDLEISIAEVEFGKEYPLVANHHGWGDTYKNNKYIGGYVE